MRNRLQQVLLFTYYANITAILSLSSSSHPDEEEAVKAHTRRSTYIKIISVDVVYEQGIGLKSSITVDKASRKDLTLQGCTNCPLQGSARTPISLSCYPSQATILLFSSKRSETTGPSS